MVDGFVFDAVLRDQRRPHRVFEVLSFAAPRKDWSPVFHDAGHFLYALERVQTAGTAVILEPSTGAGDRGTIEAFRGASEVG